MNTPTITAALPSTSSWLRDAMADALQHPIIDALHDARRMAALLRRHFDRSTKYDWAHLNTTERGCWADAMLHRALKRDEVDALRDARLLVDMLREIAYEDEEEMRS